MIVVDIETSGVYPEKNGVWQIGAVDLNSGETFLGEGKIDEEDDTDLEALGIIGKTEEELRGFEKTQKELLEEFFSWCGKTKVKNFVMQNFMDIMFLTIKARKYDLEFPMHHRVFDLHSIAQGKYADLHDGFLIKEDYSGMNLPSVLNFVGMVDDRGDHNALEDAKMTAEAFNRIIYGKGIFPEYEKFEIPEYLKKG